MAFISSSQVISQLFIKVRRSLENTAMTYVGNSDHATDIVQDVIVIMLEKERTFESEASCVCYMKQIVRNRAKNYLRNNAGVDLWETMDDLNVEDLDPYDLVDAKLSLQRFLLKYPLDIREAFIRHVIDGETSKDLAEQLDMNHDTLRRQFSRMKQELLQNAQKINKNTLFLLILSVPFS